MLCRRWKRFKRRKIRKHYQKKKKESDRKEKMREKDNRKKKIYRKEMWKIKEANGMSCKGGVEVKGKIKKPPPPKKKITGVTKRDEEKMKDDMIGERGRDV